LIGGQLGLSGGFWGAVGAVNDNFGTLGYLIVGVFVVAWALSAAVYRLKGFDEAVAS
jgi:high-affinity nickel-transport protein